MELELYQYIFLFFFVALAGFIDSMVGGGGLITIPTYISLGIPNQLILGTNKCVSTSGATIAMIRFIKNKSIDFKFFKYAILFSIIGATLGASLAKFLSNKNMIYILIVLAPIVLFLNHRKNKLNKLLDHPRDIKNPLTRAHLIALIVGLYDGFFGPGTGIFLIFSMIYFLDFSLIHASPNARLLNYSSNLGAFVYFLIKGLIFWKVAFMAIVASMVGNFLGSGQVIKGNQKVVQIVFNTVLIGLILKSLYDFM